jgi:hypothetical protein
VKSTLLKVLAVPLMSLSLALAQGNTHHVSANVPVIGPRVALGADRSVAETGAINLHRKVSPTANQWVLEASLPGAVIHDISFASPKVGYAAAELGQVWKTTDGGQHWTEIMNLNFPYYWFGVDTPTAHDVVISGFNDSTFQGVVRWSHDGGVTWTPDIVLTSRGWSYRVRFESNAHDGLVMDGLNLDAPNAAHYTTDGGETAADWTSDVPDPNGGWFGNQFSLLFNKHVRASGITFCTSHDLGANWQCGPPVDSIFDGPVFFANDLVGWVGGGEISPNVEGWVHRTTDGGKTWSARTLDVGIPIREIRFLNTQQGWAAGGNIYSNQGGIYFSKDGGQTWALDVDTAGAEMDACDSRHVGTKFQVWCAGYNASFSGVVYTLRGTAP